MMKQKSSRAFPYTFFLVLLFTAGCAHVPAREISDARILMEAAKSSCAKVYMPKEMADAEEKIRLIDQGNQKETRKSKRELKRLALEVQGLSKNMINQAARTKSDLYSRIQPEIVAAIKKIHEAEKAEANRYALKAYKLAIEHVRKARELSQDECRYPEALEQAKQSAAYAEQSIQKASAFKKELETRLPVYHIVREGETLKTIARDSPIYRDEKYWESIYKANRDQIRDPDKLYTGQQIYLPSKEEIQKRGR